MHRWRSAVAALALALAVALAPRGARGDAPPAAERPPVLALQLAAGAPDGIVLGAGWRPWTFLRLNAGASWNGLGFGIQGGATWLPFHFGITPTLTGEAGYYFPSDYAARLERWTGPISPEVRPLLEHVGYTYLSTQLGVEFGGADAFVFFVRFGVAWVLTGVQGPVTSASGSGSTTYVIQGVQARAAAPTANIGFVVYLW